MTNNSFWLVCQKAQDPNLKNNEWQESTGRKKKNVKKKVKRSLEKIRKTVIKVIQRYGPRFMKIWQWKKTVEYDFKNKKSAWSTSTRTNKYMKAGLNKSVVSIIDH